MNTKNKETQSDIEELLPWHAAGTFSRRDTQRIEEALARDPELAHHYALVREELGETIPAQRDNGRALGACDGKQAGLIASIVIKEKSASGYETASAPSTDPGFGAFTIIRFAPQASSDDITKFLEANKLQVAAGPMYGGLYKVRVAVTGLPKAELARIVKKLQEDRVVGFIATTE